jgi:hypothetical protein
VYGGTGLNGGAGAHCEQREAGDEFGIHGVGGVSAEFCDA